MVSMGASPVLAEDDPGESDRSWWERSHAQYEQVWSGQGTLVYTARHPGRQQYIEDMVADPRQVYDPTRSDYYPEIGPDTLRLAFDRRANRIRLDGTETLYFFPDGPLGERRTRATKSQVWSGEELREVRESPSGRLDAVLAATRSRLLLHHTLEFPLRTLPLEGRLPEIILRESSRFERVPAAVDGDGVRRFRVMINDTWRVLEIDKDQGFTIVRREAPATRWYPYRTVVTVVNKEYEEGVWYPSQWTSRVYQKDTDRVLSVNSLVALDFSVNMSIPDHHFDLEFPAGLEVRDLREERSEGREGRSGKSARVWIGLALVVLAAIVLLYQLWRYRTS